MVQYDEDSSTEFVNNTQQEPNINEETYNTASDKEDDDAIRRELEIQNRVFLQQSWSNVAENEEAERRLLQ